MQKILLIKTSSMGDVIHNLPVASDIRRAFPQAGIHWVVEENFAAIAALHPAVKQLIPVAIRRWRGSWFSSAVRAEKRLFKERLQQEEYDAVLDTQGLLKSALIARHAKGRRCGYAWGSAREPLAGLFYQDRQTVDTSLHAVERNRLLAAKCLGYELTEATDYGIRAPEIGLSWPSGTSPPLPLMEPLTNRLGGQTTPAKSLVISNSLPQAGERAYAVLLHATSRADKLWAEANWVDLGRQLNQAGIVCVLPWGSDKEKIRSERLANNIPGAVVPPRLSLDQAAALLAGAWVAAGVDTGLSHFAAALRVPVVGIYCATDPGLTGIYPASGAKAVNLGGTGRPPSVVQVLAAIEKVCTND